jgi:hypothetical protein
MPGEEHPGIAAPRSVVADDGTTYVDDTKHIGDADLLLRRVPSWHIIWDENENRWRPTSAAFEDHPDGSPLSVRVRPLLERMGLALESVLAGLPDFGLVEFPAGTARAKDQIVALEEVEGEPAHAVVAGKKTRSVMKHLARSSKWSMPLSEAALAKAEEKRGPV